MPVVSSRPLAVAARALALASSSLALTHQASAQTFSADGLRADQAGPGEAIVVTGLRSSLLDALQRRHEATVAVDTLTLEDLARTSGANVAEALDRLPGVRLVRDMTGEGVQVSVRGLGPEFARVLLNGAQLQVASDGGTNGGSRGRGVDFDLLPAEFFARVDVARAAEAAMPEGGVNGTVDLRTLRPSDRPGFQVTASGQAQYARSNRTVSPRGALIANWSGKRFGLLVGLAAQRTRQRVDGFESIGWTDANVPDCGPGCALPGDTGNGFSYASVVPASTGHGLRPGDPVDLAATSGLSLPQISAGLLPRLARQLALSGTRRRTAAMAALEWQPVDRLRIAFDGLLASGSRSYEHLGMQWYVRNSGPGKTAQSTGGMVPIGLTIDRNNVITSGLFANSAFLAEETLYDQHARFHMVGGEVTWQAAPDFRIEANARTSRSTFRREQPTFLFQTPMQSGIDVLFDNTGKAVQPLITANRDLGDPGLGWQWSRLNIQNITRQTRTDSARVDVIAGDRKLSLAAGAAYDLGRRQIRSYDNSAAYQLAVCGAGCTGIEGSVPNSAIAGYLSRAPIVDFGHLSSGGVGYTQFIAPDFAALKRDTGYQAFSDAAPLATTQVGGNPPGDIGERVLAAYVQASGSVRLLGRDVRANIGLRRVDTRQDVVGVALLNGEVVTIGSRRSYANWLPSGNVVARMNDRVNLRLAFARTLSRPDPALLLPSTVFTDSSAQIAAAGNPQLRPYTSTNFDAGIEWYTGGVGLFSLSALSRSIDGFTVVQSTRVRFASLGIPFGALSSTQQNVLNDRSFQTGIPVADLPISLTRPINLQSLSLRGIDMLWTQPLDHLAKGAGITVSASHFAQSSQSGLVAPGVPRWSGAVELFYERGAVSASARYDRVGRTVAVNGPLNGLDLAQYADPRGQLDLSLIYRIPGWQDRFRLTLTMLNATNAPIRTTLGYSNAAFSVYYPGPQVTAGFGAKF
ncbi:TonB-dependent receptor [Novosphingobium cyanobacteriorum]|uniref:TonB-dependent receptor n=1 Tax=Novosphingobium cyanobacteriorum TaxID=3024215 RepID=A0ABT6CD10_9SPHN|nr:TonB-dependent receptor [Novosphingobium cyanobacteriorum]MDF8331707.1 TonB-dependent receptor [Novosphingobium cyanobacteriorum]